MTVAKKKPTVKKTPKKNKQIMLELDGTISLVEFSGGKRQRVTPLDGDTILQIVKAGLSEAITRNPDIQTAFKVLKPYIPTVKTIDAIDDDLKSGRRELSVTAPMRVWRDLLQAFDTSEMKFSKKK